MKTKTKQIQQANYNWTRPNMSQSFAAEATMTSQQAHESRRTNGRLRPGLVYFGTFLRRYQSRDNVKWLNLRLFGELEPTQFNSWQGPTQRFTAKGSRCGQNLKCENLTSLFGSLRSARAARLFFLIQPIVSLICSVVVVVAVAVVILVSLAPCYLILHFAAKLVQGNHLLFTCCLSPFFLD